MYLVYRFLNTLFYFLNNIYVVLFTIIFHYFLTVSVHFNSPQGNTALYFFPIIIQKYIIIVTYNIEINNTDFSDTTTQHHYYNIKLL